MTQLEKMIESCEEFAKNPKVGNVEFQVSKNKRLFITKIQFPFLAHIAISFGEADGYFEYIHKSECFVKLTATTAQEAATEALELCRKEAQKLVELLSEPKEKKPKFIQTRINEQAEAAILQILSKGKAKRTFLTSEYYKIMKKPLRAEDLAYLVRIGKIERVEYGVYQIKTS